MDITEEKLMQRMHQIMQHIACLSPEKRGPEINAMIDGWTQLKAEFYGSGEDASAV